MLSLAQGSSSAL